LLHGVENIIEVSIADRAGNRAYDTLHFELPAAHLMKTLVGRGSSFFTKDAVLCDDGLIYMTPGNAVMIVDPERIEVLSIHPHPTYTGEQGDLACFAGSPIVYTAPDGFQFDRIQRKWTLGSIRPGHFNAVAKSRLEPGLMYVGIDGLGVVGEVLAGDTIMRRRIPIPPSNITQREQVHAIAVLDKDVKIYMARLVEGGVLAIDPKTGNVLRYIKISGPDWTHPGQSGALVLSNDDRTLFVAVDQGDPRGVAAIDTRTDEIRAMLPLPAYRPLDMALSPSGKRLFVTTTERFPSMPASNVLIDVENWRVIKEFPRLRAEGESMWDFAIAFRPDGKLFFVGHNMDVKVYLNRE
jgi:DNA-binding beta-propeller fold protein YncE